MAKEKAGRLSVIGLALGLGITWGIYQVIVGWTSMLNWGNAYVSVMSSIYIGFEPSFLGAIIGGIWAFANGLIAGALISWFYNIFKK